MTVIFYFAIIICLLVMLYIPLPWIFGKILKVRQRVKAVNSKSIYLTFDDGPGSRLTPQILEILKENNIKATFFILGRNIAGREGLIEAIINEGHVIASHSFSHLHAWKALPWKIVSDIKKCWKTINNAISTENKKYPYRPPCGKLNILSLLYLLWHRIPIIFWTVDSLDTCPNDERNVDYAAQRINEDGGGIVLFHDFDRATNQTDTYVLESLATVIKTAQELGLKFSVVDQL